MAHLYCFLGRSIHGNLWEIEEQESHHIKKVLRLNEGTQVRVFDGEGRWSEGALSKQGGGYFVECEKTVQDLPERCEKTLIIGALKNSTQSLDDIVPYLTELGVSRLLVFRPEGGEKSRLTEKHLQRWRKIVVAACKQSKRSRLMEVDMCDSLADVLDRYLQGQRGPILPDEQRIWGCPEAQPFQKTPCSRITGVIGAEAGLSDKEKLNLESFSFQPQCFSNSVLRSKTAAIYLASVWNLL